MKIFKIYGPELFRAHGALNLKNCESLQEIWMDNKFLATQTKLPDSVKNIRFNNMGQFFFIRSNCSQH